MHHNSGLTHTGIDLDQLNDGARLIKRMYEESEGEMKTGQATSGIVMMRHTMTSVMILNRAVGGKNRLPEDNKLMSILDRMSYAYVKVSLALLPIFGLVFLQFLVRDLSEKLRLIITGVQLLLVFLLFFAVQGLLDAVEQFDASADIYTVSFGFGMTIQTNNILSPSSD